MFVSVQTTKPVTPTSIAKGAFNKPQLDLLRLFAFLLVFAIHGPRLPDGHRGAYLFNQYAIVGGSGLCLFFLLSSYLITELLLREREQTGTLDLKKFYIRRALRIWPLYYVGVLLGIAFGFVFPDYRFHKEHIVELLLFFGWLGEPLGHNPFGVLWSISVEELFYAVWPLLARRRWTVPASLLLVPVSLLAAAYVQASWYNPLVHFLYFASGALLAQGLHGRAWQISRGTVVFLLAGGIGVGFLAYSPLVSYWPLRFLLLDVECLLLILGFLGIPGESIPSRLVYLGKISYGLYVFHAACLFVSDYYLNRFLQGQHKTLAFAMTILLGLTSTIVLAHYSYRYLESPFLQLKKRFERVKSRGI